MRHQIVVLLYLVASCAFAVESENVLKIHQVDLLRHLAAVKIEGGEEYKELFVESEKGEQCSLPVKGQSEGIIFLSTEKCPFERRLKAGQPLSQSLFEQLSSKEEEKEEVSGPSHYELTWRALSYMRMKTDADVDGELKGNYELTQNEFKTLPLDFELNIKGENFGVLLEPVSEDSSFGGILSPYFKLPIFDVGISASYFIDRKDEKINVGTSSGTSYTKTENFQVGAFLRKVMMLTNSKLDFRFNLGYMKQISRDNSDKAIVDYFAGGIDFGAYIKVKDNLFIGPSLGLLLGDGTITWESSTDKLSGDANVFALTVVPLVMNFEF